MNAGLAPDAVLSTERLRLEPLSSEDAGFIYALVNTKGWLGFIGDRNVHSMDDATAYVKRILGNANVCYWIVSLKEAAEPIGIVTFIKRDYLEHPDLGFAFLPAFAGKGYAFEAANCVLHFLVHSVMQPIVLATTIPANTSSIKLLTKLGFRFQREAVVGNEALHIYSVSAGDVFIA